MKYLIFDSGPLISLTMSSLLPVLEKLKENFNGDFIVTPQVIKEVVERPLKIKKYELEALQIEDLIKRDILKKSSKIIPDQKLEKEMKRVLKIANGAFRSVNTGERINMIQEGEASCLALANLCSCDNVIVIDERTTRMITEAPLDLERLMESKLHTPLKVETKMLEEFKKFRFIRSSELLFVAYKNDWIPLKKDKQLLDALLYSVKFKGTAISYEEIEEMKKLA